MNFNIWTAQISVAFRIFFLFMYVPLFLKKPPPPPPPVVRRNYRLSNFWLAIEVNKELKKKFLH
jgi:hypothetical protein